MPLHCSRRNFQNLGCFLDRESAKETKLDDAALEEVESGEVGEGVIEGEEFEVLAVVEGEGVVEGHAKTAVAFGSGAMAGVVDEDLAHDERSETEELFLIFEDEVLLMGKTKVSLVDEGGALHASRGTLSAEVAVGEVAKLIVGPGNEGFKCFGVPCWPGGE